MTTELLRSICVVLAMLLLNVQQCTIRDLQDRVDAIEEEARATRRV